MLLARACENRITITGTTQGSTAMVKLRVNGQEQSFDGDPSMPLLWYLRDELRLTGTKYGCGAALCGACTVHVDGEAARACITAVSDVNGRSVITIEGLDRDGNHPVQKAWRALNVPQCGYCQPGQIMQAAALLATNKNPSEDEINSAMSGNICRCGCYQRITAAIKAAATGA
jgi:isoquinoline 1-oxidoreductase subunit alpha